MVIELSFCPPIDGDCAFTINRMETSNQRFVMRMYQAGSCFVAVPPFGAYSNERWKRLAKSKMVDLIDFPSGGTIHNAPLFSRLSMRTHPSCCSSSQMIASSARIRFLSVAVRSALDE